jgi:hypothetical protein
MSKEEMVEKIVAVLVKVDPEEFSGEDGETKRANYLAEEIASELLGSQA